MTISKVKLSTDHILKGLDELRDQELLCDVHLVAEGAKFPAHRVVLAAASPYFQVMFTGGFKENQMKEITLNDTTSQGLKCVLDAIYTGELSLSEENVHGVLSLASRLQLNEIVKCCEEFLVANVSSENCLSFLSAAEKFDLQEAMDTCNNFVLENFSAISQLIEFKNISKQQLCSYLSSDQLKVRNGEIEVFRAAVKWFEANRSDKDSSDLVDLMEHVRFPVVPNDLLVNEILTCDIISRSTEVMEMVREALQFHSDDNVFLQPLQEGKRFEPRGEKVLALVYSKMGRSGQSADPTASETRLLLMSEKDNRLFHTKVSEKAFPIHLCPQSLALVTKGNYLFLFGVDDEYCRTVAACFDVKTNSWRDLKPPPYKPSEGVAAALLVGSIYVLGGVHISQGNGDTIDPSNFSTSVSQYSIETNSWSKLENLPKPLAFHSAASYGNYVFAAGGSSVHKKATNKLYAFDVVGKIWLRKTSMNCKRVAFRMEAVGAKLVACGSQDMPNVEIYDIVNDQWTQIQNGNLEHPFYAATVVLNDKVYVIGGSGQDRNGAWTVTDCVSCVDVDNATIRRVSKLPFQICGHSCAMLTAPSVTLSQ